jgi:hypothetical protein
MMRLWGVAGHMTVGAMPESTPVGLKQACLMRCVLLAPAPALCLLLEGGAALQ